MTRPGAPFADLLANAVRHVQEIPADVDHTDQRVLDAAIRVLARRGTREATMDDIAAESGVGRRTLFRRYAGKDQLFERALAREIAELFEGLAERFRVITDPTDQVVEAFAACVGIRNHVLFRDADIGRRDELVRVILNGNPSPLSIAHKAIRANIAHAQASGRLPAGDPSRQADALIHLCIGYLAAPSLTDDLTDPHAVERLARTAIAPILTGAGANTPQ